MENFLNVEELEGLWAASADFDTPWSKPAPRQPAGTTQVGHVAHCTCTCTCSQPAGTTQAGHVTHAHARRVPPRPLTAHGLTHLLIG